MKYSHGLLAIGLMIVLFSMFWPNFKEFSLQFLNLFRTRDNQIQTTQIDRTRYSQYITWVIGLTLLCGLYNLAASRDLKLAAQITGFESFFLAVGLIQVILKKVKPHKKRKPSR